MKAIVFALAAVLGSSSIALADGFICENEQLKVQVYNSTQPEQGTRTAAVLVISDKTVAAGRKTIARFTEAHGVLRNDGASYVANVDLRFSDSSRKGELIGGIKLGELDAIHLGVAFSYATPVAEGTLVPALMTLKKRNGEIAAIGLVCSRYLKQ